MAGLRDDASSRGGGTVIGADSKVDLRQVRNEVRRATSVDRDAEALVNEMEIETSLRTERARTGTEGRG